MFEAIIHGCILSLGLILPLGMQNIFIFNQGAAQPRFLWVLPAIITASVCDSVLIALAVLGVSVVVLGSFWIKVTLLSAGVLFLVYMGFVTWRSNPSVKQDETLLYQPKKQIAFALSVSLLNPHAILDTVGVIGTSSLRFSGTEKIAFALACIVISWIWFTGLGIAGGIIGKVDSTGHFIKVLNKLSAIVMWSTAVYIGSSILK
ncbi:LysE/ArgO family amino acid transporter [Fictibacillus sp. NRS-1165]|uniref:LysE/ArgO family amino acid transporter n=1 Tax=Fictibacillus sp. NRS-1165 TaxID=3144463 RepID=UPI003D199C4A